MTSLLQEEARTHHAHHAHGNAGSPTAAQTSCATRRGTGARCGWGGDERRGRATRAGGLRGVSPPPPEKTVPNIPWREAAPPQAPAPPKSQDPATASHSDLMRPE